MFCLLSPAKSLCEAESAVVAAFKKAHPSLAKCITSPSLQSPTKQVVEACAALNKDELRKLLKASADISNTNFQRYAKFHSQEEYVAGLMFAGVAFKSLAAEDFTEKQWESFQRRAAILSALYGFCRPMDAVKPYRLDLADRLRVDSQKDLYAFWKEKELTQTLVDVAKRAGAKGILNCASAEYSKAIDRKVVEKSGLKWIDCVFRTIHGSNLPSVRAKQARGLLVRHVVQAEAETVEDVKSFEGGDLDLRFDKDESDAQTLVFRQGMKVPSSCKEASSGSRKKRRRV